MIAAFNIVALTVVAVMVAVGILVVRACWITSRDRRRDRAEQAAARRLAATLTANRPAKGDPS